MSTVHMTEAEVARDLHAALARVQQGVEIIIEQDHRPIAVLKAQPAAGRPITEIIEEARQRNSTVTLDEDFGTDLEAIILEHNKPWQPPSWD